MRKIVFIGIVCFSTACTVGPNYRRPSLATPQSFRAPDPLPPGQADSFADLKWFEVFKDEQLQALRHAEAGTGAVVDACRLPLHHDPVLQLLHRLRVMCIHATLQIIPEILYWIEIRRMRRKIYTLNSMRE